MKRMASDGIAMLLKVLLGSLLLVTVNGESVECDKDRPTTHELSKNEKCLYLTFFWQKYFSETSKIANLYVEHIGWTFHTTYELT